jgi:mannose-1-phosphate guanylyltransferase/phosphomannomutase
MTLAVFLAGGEGTRLRPLTVSKPKPLVKVLNIPVLTYNLIRIKNIGIKEVKITLHYLPQLIISEYGDGTSLGLNIEYSVEERPLGTAGGVREAVGNTNDKIIVVSGDLITDFNLKEMLEFHNKRGSLMTIALGYSEEPYQFGIAKLNEEGRIVRYLEKPSPTEVFSNYINAGMYILEPEVLKYIPKSSEFDFSRDLIPILLSKGEPIYGFYSKCYWRDIGTIEQYLQCNHELLKRESHELYEIAIKNQKIRKDIPNLIEPSLVNEGAVIKEGAKIGPFTIIDEEVIIGNNSIISGSVISKGAYIGERCSIISSIIDKYAKIHDKTTIFENCVIGERTIIGRGTEIRPNVRIWPDKYVDENMIITSNIVTASKIFRSMFNQGLIRLTLNSEITPEYAAKFGKTIANIIKSGELISIASSSKKILELIGLPMISGAISAGNNVANLGILPMSVARLANQSSKSKFGIYLLLNERNSAEVILHLFDEMGSNIDEKTEKKIENLFYREEFRSVDIKNIGNFVNIDINYIVEYYVRVLKKLFGNDLDNEVYFILERGEELLNFLSILKKTSFNISFVNDFKKIHKLKKDSLIVKSDNSFSSLNLLNHEGEIINSGKRILLELYSIRENLDKRTLIAPKFLCDEAVRYLQGLGFEIVQKNLIFRDYSRNLTSKDVIILEPFHAIGISPIPYFDAIASSISISKLLIKKNYTLKDALEMLPEHFIVYEFEEAPLEKISKIIAELGKEEDIENAGNSAIINDEARCLIQPSIFAAGFDIISSSTSYEKALKFATIAKKYINKIRNKI